MPAVASADTHTEATRLIHRPNKPHVILHPLFVTNPCLWFPSGERDDSEGRPCIMLSRENHMQVTLLEYRHGENDKHIQVRHVDDPLFQTNPRLRTVCGAWDYARGIAYDFKIPGRDAPPAYPPELIQKIWDLAAAGKTPGEIAGAMAHPGLKAEIVKRILNGQS